MSIRSLSKADGTVVEMGVVAAFQMWRPGNVWRYFNIDEYFRIFLLLQGISVKSVQINGKIEP